MAGVWRGRQMQVSGCTQPMAGRHEQCLPAIDVLTGIWSGTDEWADTGSPNGEGPRPACLQSGAFGGAACQNRTDDLVITSDSLYRLS